MQNRSVLRLLAAVSVLALMMFATNVFSPRPTLGYTPPVFVKAVPEPRNIRAFYVVTQLNVPVDIFTVPAGKVFIVTELYQNQGCDVELRENGQNGPIRTVVREQVRLFNAGVPFPTGSTITLISSVCGSTPLRVTVSGYLADA